MNHERRPVSEAAFTWNVQTAQTLAVTRGERWPSLLSEHHQRHGNHRQHNYDPHGQHLNEHQASMTTDTTRQPKARPMTTLSAAALAAILRDAAIVLAVIVYAVDTL